MYSSELEFSPDKGPGSLFSFMFPAGFETLEFDKEYDFDISKKPYLLFELIGRNNQEIGFYFNGSRTNVDIYASENKADIMTYNATKLTNTRT